MKPLQRDGLVVAESAEHDGRTFLFSLTEQGEAMFDQAAIAWRAAQDEFEQKFGRARAKVLRTELFSITD
jgi:DNA-binding MarR family transcriptional regulator